MTELSVKKIMFKQNSQLIQIYHVFDLYYKY